MKSFISPYKTNSRAAAENSQPRLKVGQADDPLERQANAIEKIVGNSANELTQNSASENIQRKETSANSPKGQSVPTEVESSIRNVKGHGTSLPGPTKSFMESQMVADFSGVKIHTDSKASKLSQSLNANAFTLGSDIFFNQNKWSPNSADGQRLLAHELAHTLQQNAGTESIQRDEISYRKLTWADFFEEMDESHSHDALTHAGVKYSWGKNLVKWGWTPLETTDEGIKVKFTISYDPKKVSLSSYMSQEKSMKKNWLTDDEAAAKELGEDADISKARSSLLKHEQLHFDLAKKMAKARNSDIKAAVPSKAYTTTETVADEDAANIRGQELYDEKSAELETALIAVIEDIMEELGEVHDIYDEETDHSNKEKEQKEWQKNLDKKFKAARKKVKEKKKAEAEAAAEETETAAEEEESEPVE